MNKSENISELAKALSKAQAEMSGAKKSSNNPFFKSKYADLKEVIECVKEPFADNGLSFVQFPISNDGFAGVETVIMHSSGEWISNEYMLKVSKNDPQGMGSAITYARRYALQAACGVPSEDDDAESAMGRSVKVKKAPEPKPEPKQTKTEAIELLAAAEDFSKLVGAWNKVSKENKKNEDVIGFKETRKKELEQ
jgi:hypothetical protein